MSKMSKKDKNSFIIIAFIMAYIALVILFRIGANTINPLLFCGITVALQFLVLMPIICKLYYEAHNCDAGFMRFIPLYNESMIFSPKLSMASLVLWIATIVFIALSFFDTSALEGILGRHLAMVFPMTMLKIGVILYIINNFVRSIGLLGVKREIDSIHAELTGSHHGARITDVFQYVVFFIPILRVVGLLFVFDRLNKIVRLNGFKAGDTTDEDFVEE